AWDYPQRGHKRFIDLHAAGVNGGLMLPLHLGWWGFQSFNPPQVEPSYPDVIEHLGARLIGWDAGISLTAGVDQQALRKTPLYGRAAEILRTCEELRHAKVFDETTKARLRDPQLEFCLRKDADGKPRFSPVRTHSQTVAMDESWSQAWILTNGFREQPLRFRLEALISTVAHHESNTVALADLARDPEPLWKRSSANGVSFRSESLAHADESLGIICATNTGQVPRHAAWARLQKRFEPTLDTQEGKALGLDIEGDGSGAVLAIRLESPHHVSYGAIADRYVPLNFTGRRRYTLVETESSRWSDYVWNDGKHPYHVYRETVNFGAIESVGIWLQNLPAHRETRVRLGPVVAVPLRSTPVKNPRLVLNGQPLEFQIELPPGSWIEGNGPEDCLAYNARGESLGKVTLQGDWPKLRRGANSAEFACEKSGDPNPRARITTFVLEDPF
ncbi:MAG TPA: hypothetical protein P5055_11650, partial [Candidatus Paceibacterota bacterium]|nr:hypothetical protein [Candidatus Paceibacterota bacterium]